MLCFRDMTMITSQFLLSCCFGWSVGVLCWDSIIMNDQRNKSVTGAHLLRIVASSVRPTMHLTWLCWTSASCPMKRAWSKRSLLGERGTYPYLSSAYLPGTSNDLSILFLSFYVLPPKTWCRGGSLLQESAAQQRPTSAQPYPGLGSAVPSRQSVCCCMRTLEYIGTLRERAV